MGTAWSCIMARRGGAEPFGEHVCVSDSVSGGEPLAVSVGGRCWLIPRADDITHLSMAGGAAEGPGVAP
jgi:hypothetical protein